MGHKQNLELTFYSTITHIEKRRTIELSTEVTPWTFDLLQSFSDFTETVKNIDFPNKNQWQ